MLNSSIFLDETKNFPFFTVLPFQLTLRSHFSYQKLHLCVCLCVHCVYIGLHHSSAYSLSYCVYVSAYSLGYCVSVFNDYM